MLYAAIILFLSSCSPSYQFNSFRDHVRGLLSSRIRLHLNGSKTDVDIKNDAHDRCWQSSSDDIEPNLLQLAQSHFMGQALLALLRLGVFDVLQTTDALSVDDIIIAINKEKNIQTSTINREALFRCLRLVCTSGVAKETSKQVHDGMEATYLATDMGARLRTTTSEESMAPFLLHWLESPLWDAWKYLPEYVQSDSDKNNPPFDRANGMSASEFYASASNAESCLHRNSVARWASSKEIASITEAMKQSSHLNESFLAGKVVVDVGGGYGDFGIALKEFGCKCYCLDLPEVIADATSEAHIKDNVNMPTLVAGNMFDASTIPTPCDVIFTKHVLCDFSDDDVILALQSFRKALANSKEAKVVIMDAVLPNGDDLNGKWNAAVSFDVLLMLSGRRGERSIMEWSNLANKAGFVVEEVLATTSVTVDLAVLSLDS
jgi:hypothetical protein